MCLFDERKHKNPFVRALAVEEVSEVQRAVKRQTRISIALSILSNCRFCYQNFKDGSIPVFFQIDRKQVRYLPIFGKHWAVM